MGSVGWRENVLIFYATERMPKALSLAVELFLFFFSSPNLGSFGRGTASHQTYARGSAVAEHGVLLRNLAHLSPNFMGAFIFDHTRL